MEKKLRCAYLPMETEDGNTNGHEVKDVEESAFLSLVGWVLIW